MPIILRPYRKSDSEACSSILEAKGVKPDGMVERLNGQNSLETKILCRKVSLKNQALKVIRNEREELRYKLTFIKLKSHLLRKIKVESWDPELSQQLDCVEFLLGTLGGRSSDLSGDALTILRPANSLLGRENQSEPLQG